MNDTNVVEEGFLLLKELDELQHRRKILYEKIDEYIKMVKERKEEEDLK